VTAPGPGKYIPPATALSAEIVRIANATHLVIAPTLPRTGVQLATSIGMTWLAILLVAGNLMGAEAGRVKLVEKGGNMTEATIVVDAPPHEVFRAATDYRRWPEILSDVTSVEVKGERVRFHSKTFGQTVTVEFANVPDREVSFRGVAGPPGGRSSGRYVLVPIDGGSRTRVTALMYAEVVGVPGIFVRDARIQKMRRAKLARDLTDTARWVESHRERD
jgi:hypothetical protein